ncbi:MAG: hypothetical protein R3E68_18230 [Burkholderiaceae bacterium]
MQIDHDLLDALSGKWQAFRLAAIQLTALGCFQGPVRGENPLAQADTGSIDESNLTI